MVVWHHPDSMDMNLSKLQEIVKNGTWHAAVRGVTKSQTRLRRLINNNMWDLSRPGIELIIFELQSRFLTTGPPAKPPVLFVCFVGLLA